MVIETATGDTQGAFNALSASMRSLLGTLAFSRANIRLLASNDNRLAIRIGREFVDAARSAICLANAPMRTLIVSGSITNAKAYMED